MKRTGTGEKCSLWKLQVKQFAVSNLEQPCYPDTFGCCLFQVAWSRNSSRVLLMCGGWDAAWINRFWPICAKSAFDNLAVAVLIFPPAPGREPLFVMLPKRCHRTTRTFCSTAWGFRGYSSTTSSGIRKQREKSGYLVYQIDGKMYCCSSVSS